MGGKIFIQDGVEDHQHTIFGLPATVAVSTAAGRLKAATCAAIRRELKLSEFEWQVGYSAHSLNAHDFADAYDYVKNQKAHHGRGELIEEFEPTPEE